MCERDFVSQFNNYLQQCDDKLQHLHDPIYQCYRPTKKDDVPSLLNVNTRLAEWRYLSNQIYTGIGIYG